MISMEKLIAFSFLVIYVWGIWKFWAGYRMTNFSLSFPTRLSLSLLWPVLVIANGSYRRNFVKALKG